MEDKVGLFYTGIFCVLITFITGFLLQETSRSGVFFGNSLPSEYKDRDEFKCLKKLYKRNYSISASIYSILFLVILYYYTNPAALVIGILAYIPVLNINYYYIYFRVKKLKKNLNIGTGGRNIVVVDTSFRAKKDKKIIVSTYWFILPFILIVIDVIVTFIFYERLPEKIPTHWGITGKPDGWADKSVTGALNLPFAELVLTAVMYGIYKIIEKSKQQINPENIQLSKEQNRRFRFIWSFYVVFIALMFAVMFTLMQFNILGLINIGYIGNKIIVGLSAVVTVILALFSMLIGQGGSRIKIKGLNDKVQNVFNRDDDRYWKLGDFYYNPEDPSLFVEKRMGVGWDLNYGRPAAWVIIGLVLILIIAFVVVALRIPV